MSKMNIKQKLEEKILTGMDITMQSFDIDDKFVLFEDVIKIINDYFICKNCICNKGGNK